MTDRAKTRRCPVCVVAEEGDPKPPLTLDHVILHVCEQRSEHLLCQKHMLRSLVVQFLPQAVERTEPVCSRCDDAAEFFEPAEDGELCFCTPCFAAYEEEVAS